MKTKSTQAKMKKIVKAAIPPNIQHLLSHLKASFFDVHSTKFYSQEGEDMILRRVFEKVEDGFYVDVGAHHPQRFSNTFYFYKLGWSGINIDAMPGSMASFEKVRPRDINIEAAIAKSRKEMTFFIFNEPALNSFDDKLSFERSKSNSFYKIMKEKKIFTKTLKEVLIENLPKGKKINFLSVDVEGLDLEVLESNDWELFRPDYILVECISLNMNEIQNNKVYKFLVEKKYSLFAKTVNTMILKNT